LQTFVLADLKAHSGFVNKDTVAGGYGSRFRADSIMTRLAKNIRFVFKTFPAFNSVTLRQSCQPPVTGLFTHKASKSRVMLRSSSLQ
jgi:hypothetical protein